MKITSFGATDPGKKRAGNEDAYLLNDRLFLYAVADGIGGNEGGEVASRVAVDTITEAMPDLLGDANRTPPSGVDRADQPFSALRQAVILSNRNIHQERDKKPELTGMGTTLTVLLLRKERAYIATIGDSRAYLLRSGEFRQLTVDHSFVREQVDTGLMTAEGARTSPYRHVITRALGIDENVRPDFFEHKLQKDDTFLLCTDGLTEMVDDAEISRTLSELSPADAVRKLLAAANDHGGVDNITALVVRVTEM